MKKAYFIVLLLGLFYITNMEAQVKDNTIRIVGQASKTFDAIGLHVDFTAKEIVPNEYRKIRYKSIDDVLAEFKTNIINNGLSDIEFTKKPLKIERYSNGNQLEYYIKLNDKKQIEKVIASKSDGISLSGISYQYEKLPKYLSEELIKMTIEDAKRKAKEVAKSINKKIGNIISIVDKTGGVNPKHLNKKMAKSDIKYKTNITFELLN